MEDYEIFYDEVKDMDGVMRITIPSKIAKMGGYKSKSKVRVLLRLVYEE